jgi:hypothetical protein
VVGENELGKGKLRARRVGRACSRNHSAHGEGKKDRPAKKSEGGGRGRGVGSLRRDLGRGKRRVPVREEKHL